MDVNKRELQGKLLDMLGWVHEFCVKHNLTYYVVGGTLLGAVRHKGFIPWDDDVDIAMPRDEYERFIRLMKAQHSRYVVEILEDNNEDYYYPYAKVYDTYTTLVETARDPIKRGAYIDVFPLDGISNAKENDKKYKSIKLKGALLSALTCEISEHRSMYKNMIIKLARLIPLHKKIRKMLIVGISRQSKTQSYNDCDYVCNYVGNWGSREIVLKDYFGKPQAYAFENLTIYGVAEPDLYLRNVYGDYMVLPPEEKRSSNHFVEYINLDESYLS